MIINGEQIADQELCAAAQREGQITLYRGWTADSESALLDQCEDDTGLEVKLIRLTPNRLSERIVGEFGAGGSALALTRFQRAVLGDDSLRDYAEDTRVFDSLGAELDSLARGEIDAGTVVVSSVNIVANENAPVTFVVSEEGVTAYDYYTGVA